MNRRSIYLYNISIMPEIQIASDLHIEYKNDEVPNPLDYITPTGQILILAGDIGSLYKLRQLEGFLSELSKLFQAVLYVPGNHEFYTIPLCRALSYEALEERLKYLETKIKNLHILNRESVRIGNTCIIGCTLWSNPKCNVPPFIVRVAGLHTREYMSRHLKDVQYIENMIKYCVNHGYELIIVTHHPPTLKAVEGWKRKKFISLYATDLEYLIERSKISYWICGHTHQNIDIVRNNCRIVTNQKGKVKDNIQDYKKSFLLSF